LTARTGQLENDRQNKTAVTGLQEKTARTELTGRAARIRLPAQNCKNKTTRAARTGQIEWDRQIKTDRTELPDRTANTGFQHWTASQDCQHRTASTGLLK
jgi:hypothetical protein